MPQKSTTKEVNDLVKKAFGSQSSNEGTGVITGRYIGKELEAVGELQNSAGSHLLVYGTIFGSNERKAKKYARLYEEQFGEEVTIERKHELN